MLRREIGAGQAGVVAEFIDQPLHGLHLIDDGGHGFVQHLAFGLGQLAGQLVRQPLGRELNGRERVFDFVRQPPRSNIWKIKKKSKYSIMIWCVASVSDPFLQVKDRRCRRRHIAEPQIGS